MVRIERQAVIANGQAIAAFVDGPDALMAIAAERAQRAKAELVVIAAMPWMMVRDGGRRDAVLFLAQGTTQRGIRKLVLDPSSPGLSGVSVPPMERLGRG